MTWQEHAACRGMDQRIFFGGERMESDGRHIDVSRAVAVCERCPVRIDCLSYAMDVGEIHGVWGGLTENERRRSRRKRRGKGTRPRVDVGKAPRSSRAGIAQRPSRDEARRAVLLAGFQEAS